MGMHDNLEAFRASFDLGLEILKSSESWPMTERFGLTSQIRRSSTSVSINIAEGYAKQGRNEFRKYLDIALGSLAETQVLLRFALEMRFLTSNEAARLEALRERASKLTWGLYKATTDGRGRPSKIS